DGDSYGDVCDVCPNDTGNDADNDGSCASEGDCNDADDSIFPGAPEVFNAIDDDCDGVIPGTEIDDDGDSFAECEGDCNDASTDTFPGAAELCDRADNDCDGVIPGDEIDNDGDGQTECESDCDDNDASNYTGNTEICDGQDNNCDNAVDEGFPNFDGDAFADCVDPDDDNDGVDDGDDLCIETLADDWAAGVPSTGTLGSNRWMYDAALDVNADGSFTQGASGNGKNNGNGNGNNGTAAWTYDDMGGCSCAQIIDELALGNGHTKFGCSNSAMEDWALIVNP
ncbi:MAG: putative metal-binding motif-containing protein, partial [Deltaproteobacteria bacterium]|nr:putative metal-binding motif-containing protein [Deltaproteobacteria bacterium]